jgi:putative membrane protein
MKTTASSGLNDAAKRTLADAVRAIESQSAAEVVIALRPSSGTYRQADYLLGSIVSFVALLVFLFHPAEFQVETMPIDALIAFALGVALSAWLPPLKRLFSSPRERARTVALAARAAFVDLGVSKTSGRTGVLVYISRLEHAVEIVTDIGVHVPALGERWSTAVASLKASARGRFDAQKLASALTELGPPLAQALPRAADDVNELPDEVV